MKKYVKLILSFFLLVSLFGCSKINSNEQEIKVLQVSEKTSDNSFTINPEFIKIEAEFEKRVYSTYVPSIYSNLDPNKKYVALTFDDGPAGNSTARILNTLAKYNIKGTWFLVGNRVYPYAGMAKNIANAGHELANHSYSHPELTALSYNGYMEEINKTQDAIYNVTGHTPKFLRPPYGAYNSSIAANCGLKVVTWNVDSLDWQSRNGNMIYNQVMSTLQNHSVILFHDLYESTADAIELLVPKLIEMGYEFLTISQFYS